MILFYQKSFLVGVLLASGTHCIMRLKSSLPLKHHATFPTAQRSSLPMLRPLVRAQLFRVARLFATRETRDPVVLQLFPVFALPPWPLLKRFLYARSQ